ncbi:MAG: carboxypeptidase regulatory-like domain-containing protein [Archangium sp.]
MRRRFVIGGVIVACVVVALFLARGGDEVSPATNAPRTEASTSTESRTPSLAIAEDRGNTDAVTVQTGSSVTIIVGADGKPLAGAAVIFYDQNDKPTPATTGADGRTTLLLPPGSWLVSAQANGFGLGVAPRFHTAAGGEPLEFRIDLLHLAEIRGVVVNEAGQPIAGARVDKEETGSDGRFAVKVEVPGSVLADAEGYGLRAVDVTAASQDITIVLVAVAPVTGHITGRVVDEDGVPVSGATVDAAVTRRSMDELKDAQFGTAPRSSAKTDGAGRFDVKISTSTVNLRATADTGVSDAFEADAGSDVTITLKPIDRSVRGRVVDASGKPHTLFRVGLPSDRVDLHHSADGTFIVEHLERTVFKLAVAADGEAPVELKVDVRERDADLGDIVLERARVVRGVVVDNQGTPIADARIIGKSSGDESRYGFRPETVSHADGAFQIGIPRKGPIELAVSAPGFLRWSGAVPQSPVRIVLTTSDGGTATQYSGIGMVTSLSRSDAGDGYRVDELMPHGSAREFVQVGDEVIAVDGQPAVTGDVQDFLFRVRGVEGTTVVLTLRRNGQILDVRLVRRRITMSLNGD